MTGNVVVKRFLTALWGVPLVVVTVWFSMPEYPVPLFSIFAALWGLLAAREYYRLIEVDRIVPLAWYGLLLTAFFITWPQFEADASLPHLAPALTVAVILSLVMLLPLRKTIGLFQRWAGMLGGAIYIGWLLGLLVWLRLDGGRNWALLAIFGAFGSDTFAYFIGRALGRHKMAPQISPGKTREGAAGGLLGSVIVGLLFTVPAPWGLPLTWGRAVVLGAIISVFAQLGDLIESLLKRQAGVKDAGSIIAGHGGALDRLDSVLFAGAAVFLYYTLLHAA